MRFLRRKIFVAVTLSCLLALVSLAVGRWWVGRTFPQVEGTVHLPGLKESVRIYRDEWGVPHIYASNIHDLYFAQGVVHAQDRLWQMDFQRRVGLGRLSELLGEPTLEIDRFLRTIGTNVAARRDWEALDQTSRAALEAYSEGVNQYVATLDVLPLEYQLLGVGWAPWEPTHTLAWAKMMQWDLNGNWEEELLRARLSQRLGPELTGLLLGDESEVGSTLTDVGQPELAALAATLRPAGIALSHGASDRGSNAWAIAGTRSQSGQPLLASDPHLGPAMPGTWYLVGLHGGGVKVVGASLPGAPGVIIGHNADIAWGVTNLPTDTQDLFIERLNEAGDAYEWQGEMVPLQVRREVIRVKGQEDVMLEVRESRHGPLLNDVVEGLEVPIAMQWYATSRPSRLVDSVLALNRATDRESFLAALRHWDTPAQNFVYADREGNIGYVATGALPIRPAAGGMLPQPGWTGEWEWEGIVPLAELPQRWNPPEAHIITANQRPFPDDYPYYTGTAWAVPFRAERIREMLEVRGKLTVEDFQTMQRDVTSLPAQKLVPLLVSLRSDDIIVQRAQEQLAEWNFQIDGRLPGAGIYEVAHGFVVRGLLADELGEDEVGGELLTGYLNHSSEHHFLVARLLDEPEHPLWDDRRTPEREGRDEVLLRALLETRDWLGRRYGDVPHEWFWDRMHRLTFDHPLGVVQPLDRIFNRQVDRASGDRHTINALGFSYGDGYEVDNLPSYRQIVDLSDWERSRMIQTTGQSGLPFHPHYDDMIAPWLRGELLPMGWHQGEAPPGGSMRLLRLEPEAILD